MASNDQWPPVASTGKGSAKVNGNRRNIKDSQQKVLSFVTEMFGSVLEPEVILTVVQNCNWEMRPSIDGLITLTETVDDQQVWNNTEKSENIVAPAVTTTQQILGLKGGNKEVPKNESAAQEFPTESQGSESTLLSKWDKAKKSGAKNRMDSFCGNIAKLKSSGDGNTSSNTESVLQKIEQKPENPAAIDDDLLFNDILNYGAAGMDNISDTSPKLHSFGPFPEVPLEAQTLGMYPPAGASPWPRASHKARTTRRSFNVDQCTSPTPRRESVKKQKFLEAKAAAENREFNKKHGDPSHDSKANMRKAESESFCGLKVQYRVSGMESISDDDADVVIEDEASDYKINLSPSTLINVSQFLSLPTQTPPRHAHPEFHMISTPSPPRTPQRFAHESRLSNIKSTVQSGHKIMILLRGLPGSGKSTLANHIVATTVGGNPAAYIFNTDDFFVTLGRGVYKYDPSKLQDAHNSNHKRVWNAVKEGRSPIIVDNTNVEAWEMRPYAAMAVENGYIVEILEPNTPWSQNINELARKNSHNVPKTKIRERAERFEPVPSGKHLLDRFSLKYSPQNKPPQQRLIPMVKPNVSDVADSIADIKSNWSNHDKNNYVLTSQDIESMQNIDETHSAEGVVSVRASTATDSSKTSSNLEKEAKLRDELFNHYLQELQDSDDESFEMLEGSGSDDSHPSLASTKHLSEDTAEDSVAKSKDSSPIAAQQVFGAIGSERKGSLSVGSSVGNLENDKTEMKDLSPNTLHQALPAIKLVTKGSLSVGSSVENLESNETETKNLSPSCLQQPLGAIGSERKGSSSIGSSAGNLESNETETKDLSPSGLQQPLGAIGSERKGSFSIGSSAGNLTCDKSEVKASNDLQTLLRPIGSERRDSNSEKRKNIELEAKDNVLAQCWDFTLLLGRNKIHSRHSKYDLPSAPLIKSEIKNPEDFVKISAERDEEADEEADKNYDDIWNLETALNRVIFEKSKRQDFAVHCLNDDNASVDEEKENLIIEELFELENEVKNDVITLRECTINTQEINEEITVTEMKSSELCDASSTENLAKSELFHPLVGKIEEATEVTEEGPTEVTQEESTEIPELTPKVSTAFGTFFNMLKTSILGGAEETSSSDLKDDSGSSLYETAFPSKSSSVEKINDQKENISNDTVDSSSALEKSSESDSPAEIAPNAINETATKYADDDNKIYADLSTNPFREEIMKSREKKSIHHDAVIVTDNINSISWKESPFPIDCDKIPVLSHIDDNKAVQKTDAFTNTTYYDFNVAYVGGTSEPGYRELLPVSRCINEGPSVAKSERPPVILMLDKSSMTSEVNILASEPNLNIEKEKDSSNRIEELVELFPNIPIDSLEAFYNQECKGNFDWAVEVLLEDVPADFTIKGLENRRSNVDTDDSSSAGADSEKKSNIVLGRVKQRSHSSSPRHRRHRTKDFRSFSMEYVEDRAWSSEEPPAVEKDNYTVKQNEDMIIELFYEHAASAASLPVAIADIPEASSSSVASGLTETETNNDVDDTVELDFGREFVNQLEQTFGNTDFTFPDEFKPVIRIKKSMAEELHALWIQSMYDQLNERHAKLDKMIAKDEEIARALDREETVQPTREPVVPNLEEIMNMEMALACYKNEMKEKLARETPNDMASRLSRQMLYESLPDIDPQTLSEILKAHDGNFKETCETIENSTGRTISKSDTLKKQQSLLDRVKEESKNRGIPENLGDPVAPLVHASPDVKAEKLSYNAVLGRGQDAREEAQKQFSLRMENINKAAEAYRKGQPGVAAYYSQMAKLHSENFHAAHAEAAEAFISAQIDYTDDENTLDLHNFFVPEALLALDRFLEIQSKKLGKSNKRSSTLYIITGRGARSNNGLSKIKPAVSKKLISRNIRFTETNPGCLKVTLSRRNGILE